MSSSLNKHVFITGGARGIGLASVNLFLENGAKVTVADLGEATEEINSLLKTHHNLQYFSLDITKVKDIEPVWTQAENKLGPVEVLFNNAGIFDMAPILESDEAMYDKLFAVNVKGMFFVMQMALKKMMEHKIEGSIINLASQAGRRGEALVSHYCATKAAVINYTQSAALAGAPYKIRVNAISPGVIDTPMWKHVDSLFAKYENLAPGEKKKQVGLSVPLGYMGEPKQVAEVALFLASDSSNYITAQTINVDGGNVMS